MEDFENFLERFGFCRFDEVKGDLKWWSDRAPLVMGDWKVIGMDIRGYTALVKDKTVIIIHLN